MGLFSLPQNWVYVIFEDGARECVENTDYFIYAYACEAVKEYDNYKGHGKIKAVEYVDRNENLIARWKF